MSFSANITGHVDPATADAEAVETEIVAELRAVVAKFSDHITGGSFSGSVLTNEVLTAPAPTPGDVKAAQGVDQPAATATPPETAPPSGY